jgi:large subunit ribosomal protein L20
MARVKRGNTSQQRHKKALKYASGFRGSKSRLFRSANQAVMKAWLNAYRDRRKRKRDFRSLWITRINAACRIQGISYSAFINALTKAKIEVNRKMLAELTVNHKEAFSALVSQAIGASKS